MSGEGCCRTLKAFLKVLVYAFVFIAILYVVDGVVLLLGGVNTSVAETLNTTKETYYSTTANNYLGQVAWLVIFILAGIFLIYGIHTKRR